MAEEVAEVVTEVADAGVVEVAEVVEGTPDEGSKAFVDSML